MNSEKNEANAVNAKASGTGPFSDLTTSELTRDKIEKQAYFFWLEGGCREGCHEDDWFRAERYLSSQNTGLRRAA
jgi:hypothetical protein